MHELEQRAAAALKSAVLTIDANRPVLSKGFPNGQAEAGVHVHNLNRETGRTKLDGVHQHAFRLPAAVSFRAEDGTEVSLEEGAILLTEEDGPHQHELTANMGDPRDIASHGGSEHRHLVALADGAIELITATDGSHIHDLQTWSSAFDGTHTHYIRLLDVELESLTGAAFWAALGEPPMNDVPPAPPASELAIPPEGVVLDPEELDVRTANVAAGKRSLVVDPLEDLDRPAELDPNLADLANCETIDAIAETVLAARRASDVPVLVWQAEPPSGRLPSLKVADPSLVVSRLVDGQPTGLISRQRQAARVGKAQALVNEVGSVGTVAVWGIVAQAAPKRIDSVEQFERYRPDIAEGATRPVVSLSKGSWYLPLDLAVVFDPPVELKAPPAGRRFASEIDFGVDAVKARQLTIDGLLRLAARDELVDFVRDPAPASLRKSTDATLVEVDRGLHELFGDLFAGNDAPEAGDVPRREIVTAHVLALRELERRGIETPERDGPATETALFVRGQYPAEPAELGKQRGEGHIHPLPDPIGGMTEPAAGRDHLHGFAVDGEQYETGPPVQDRPGADVRHRHEVSVDGLDLGLTGTEHGLDGARKQVDESANDNTEAPIVNAEKSCTIRIVKADESNDAERYVFGVVLVPDEPDAQGDIYSAADVRKAAHSYMEHFGGDTFKIMHNGEPVEGVVVLETYLSKVSETHSNETFPVGTWFLATRVNNDDLWEAIQRGAFTGYSMGGTALREALAS